MHKVLSCRDEQYETVITAVGHWAVHLPTDLRLQQSFYKLIDTFIHTNIVKELLYSKVVTSEEPLTCTWYKDYEIPAHTRCMMAGIKTLANWMCARKNPTNMKIILTLVWLIQDNKENWKDTNM
ncbi:unnamed protein product, partial [Timema podura]|nr:unnamed protein product [Timema podura]